MGKVLEKGLKIIGLDRRKCRGVVDQDSWGFLERLNIF